MKFSLSTGTFYAYPLSTVLRWAREAGFDGVELVTNPEAILRGGVAIRELARAQALDIYSSHPTLVPLPGWRERRGGLDRTFSLAQAAGAHMLIVHTPRSQSLDCGEGLRFREKVAEWQATFARAPVSSSEQPAAPRIVVENRSIRTAADHRFALTSLDSLRAFADQYGVGLVLDTTHAGTAHEDLLQAYQTFNGRLANVHLSDMDGSVPLTSPSYKHRVLGQHMYPGQGSLPLVELLTSLASGGFTGPVTLEVHPIALRVWWPPAVRRHLKRAMEWLRASVEAEPVATRTSAM